MCAFRKDVNQFGKFINLDSIYFQQSSYISMPNSTRERERHCRSGKAGSGKQDGYFHENGGLWLPARIQT